MNAAARKAAGGGTARAPALVLTLLAAGAFLISYNFFAMLFHGGGGGDGVGAVAAAGTRDPVVAMPAWMREAADNGARRRPFHVALTATDAPYSRWQCRVMYFWYKRMQGRPGGEAMGGFTRVLHSGKPDGLMDEIPTFVVDPLPAGKDHVRNRKQKKHLFLSPSANQSVVCFLIVNVEQCGATQDLYAYILRI